ncbi:hypothetical protein [Prosthecobacter sp.]|uniref:hypothetical protein n=1 Tax=Prosthecobacter sp. TaxID=1965333 RepID=UPI00378500E8
MKLRFYSVALMMLMSVLAGGAAEADETAEARPVIVNGELWMPKGTPMAKLPEGIASTEGKVTLFADYARAKKGEPIDVYLINRSEKDLALTAEDGDVYLKLEARGADGTWKRVQPHLFSRCGNSYHMKPVVQKGCFYLIKGHQPKAGDAGRIRFHLYLQEGLDLSTDTGDGLVSAEEAQKAAHDELVIRTASFEKVRDLATGAQVAEGSADEQRVARLLAIQELGLGRFKEEQVLPLLEEIEKKHPEQKPVVEAARALLKETKGR